jgi:3'-phosphoadenosine 5'-phosphosulfate sulfotransferase (PAPS reductase)/FAD synthetase
MKVGTTSGPVRAPSRSRRVYGSGPDSLPSEEIIQQAIRTFQPKMVLLLFSGGHDSLCSTHWSATCLQSMGIAFTVYHGNTGIGIRETRQFVHDTCSYFGWPLYEGRPAKSEKYEILVKKYGFPGPASHKYMYRNLKEHPLRKYVTHTCKTSVYARENVLLLTGIRRSESKIRMGYSEFLKKEGSRVWCSPLFFWSEQDIHRYMEEQQLPRNPVKDKICISGECLCGAFAGKEEWFEINLHFPEAAKEIKRIHRMAKANGHPWGWASNPKEYNQSVETAPPNLMMCVGCEAKNKALLGDVAEDRKHRKRLRRRERIRQFHPKKRS